MPGSVTSICRSWGTTKNVSLKSIYNFLRYRFMYNDFLDQTWKEPKGPFFEIVLGVPPLNQHNFMIESGGINSDYYEIFIVSNEGLNSEGKVEIKTKDGDFEVIDCDSGGISNSGSKPGCVYGFDPKDYGFDEGKFSIRLNDAGYLKYAIYDYRALRAIGMMYDEVLACAVSREYSYT